MARKSKKSGSSSNCSDCAAKKSNGTQFEWGVFIGGASRGLMNLVSVYRFYEFIKSLIEQNCSSG